LGSWDLSCALSGVNIGVGDRCCIIPIKPVKNSYDNELVNLRKIGKPSLISNEGSNIYFQEVAYPIFGVYADYGEIDTIEKNASTEVLEEYYGLTIEQICSVLCDNRRDDLLTKGMEKYSDSNGIIDVNNPRHMELLKTSLTWIHGTVYDELLKAKTDENDSDMDLGKHGLLTYLGFKQIEDNDDKRYNLTYQKDNLKVASDGTWLHTFDKNQGLYSLKSLKKYCIKNKTDIDISEIEKWSSVKQVLTFSIDEKRNRGNDLNHYFLGDRYEFGIGFDMNLEQHIKVFGEKEGKELFDEQESNKTSLTTRFKRKAKENKAMIDIIADWFKVKYFFFAQGKFLYPVGTSPQCGDDAAVKAVAKAAIKALR
jgi:hypothetical protein